MYETIRAWLGGFYRICIKDGDALRLYNACCSRNISVTDIREEAGESRFTLARDAWLAFAAMLEEEALSAQVLYERGLPFLWRKARGNYFFLSGALLFMALIMLFSNLTLHIEVRAIGEFRYISVAEIRALAADCGIKRGAFIPLLDFDSAEAYIRLKNQGISFAGISREGTEIIIEIKEKTLLDAGDAPLPCGDIVAQCDAVIEQLFVLGGTALVAEGDAVQAGQILIAGYEGEKQAAAQGMIRARVKYEGHAAVPLRQEQFVLSGNSAYSLYLCWDDTAQLIIAGESAPPFAYFKTEDEKEKLYWRPWAELPCFLVRRTYYEQEVREVELTMQEARLAAAELSYAGAVAQLPIIGSAVVSKETQFAENNPAEAEARTVIEAIRDFGIFRPFD